jgi:hypothetical protein
LAAAVAVEQIDRQREPWPGGRLSCLPPPTASNNQPVSTIDRPLPPLNADERTTLEGWLDFHRANGHAEPNP